MTVKDALEKRQSAKVETKKPSKFQKAVAKYTRRWRGRDGKWRYAYADTAKKKSTTKLAQEQIKRMKKIDTELKKESKGNVAKGIYKIEGGPSSILTFASADKDALVAYVVKETEDPVNDVRDRIKKRKDGAYVYEETEDIYE